MPQANRSALISNAICSGGELEGAADDERHGDRAGIHDEDVLEAERDRQCRDRQHLVDRMHGVSESGAVVADVGVAEATATIDALPRLARATTPGARRSAWLSTEARVVRPAPACDIGIHCPDRRQAPKCRARIGVRRGANCPLSDADFRVIFSETVARRPMAVMPVSTGSHTSSLGGSSWGEASASSPPAATRLCFVAKRGRVMRPRLGLAIDDVAASSTGDPKSAGRIRGTPSDLARLLTTAANVGDGELSPWRSVLPRLCDGGRASVNRGRVESRLPWFRGQSRLLDHQAIVRRTTASDRAHVRAPGRPGAWRRTMLVPSTSATHCRMRSAATGPRDRSPQSGLITSCSLGMYSSALRISAATCSAGSTTVLQWLTTPMRIFSSVVQTLARRTSCPSELAHSIVRTSQLSCRRCGRARS